MLTVKNTFELFDVINKHFHNDNDSRIFISEIEEIMDNKVDLKMNDFATRKDLTELRAATKQDYTELKSELKQDMVELKAELKEDIAGLRIELKQDMTELKSEFKQDVAELRADFNRLDASVNLSLANSAIILERTQKEHLKWTMGLMIAMLTLAVAVIKLT